LNDMGDNVNDSMAYAVENARCVVSLVTDKYKESANCRKELEMADSLKKPIVFVVAQSDFAAQGWLRLLMGAALYVYAGEDEAKWPGALPEIVKRVEKL